MRFSVIFCLLVFISINYCLFAEPLELTILKDQLNLGRHIEYIEDTEGKLTFEQILAIENNEINPWIKSNRDFIGFGFTSSVYWVRLKIRNSSPEAIHWYLNQEYPLIDKLTLYHPDQTGTYQKIETGDTFPFHNRPYYYRYFVFPLVTAAKTTQFLYIRYQSTSSMNLALKIWQTDAFQAHRDVEMPLLWSFYGMFAIMFIFNLIVFINIREVTYLYYITYIGTFLLLMMFLNGIGFQYLWPNSKWWTNAGVAILIPTIISSLISFAVKLTGIDHTNPIINWTLRGAIFLSISIVVFTVITDNYVAGITVSTALTGIMAPIGLAFAVYRGYHPSCNNRESRFFVWAFTPVFFGIFLFVFKTFSLLPINFITNYSIQIGSLLQIALLSFALPRRLSELKDKLINLNENLENLVEERTLQLEATQEKLVQAAHKAGMADMARDTVHNIGNIANSMLVSARLIDPQKVIQLVGKFQTANSLLRDNIHNLEEFITKNPKGKKLLEYYLLIEDNAVKDQEQLLKTVDRIVGKAEEINHVIKAQHDFIDQAFYVENCQISRIIEEVLVQQNDILDSLNIEIKKKYYQDPVVPIQKTKMIYVFTSIITNSATAMSDSLPHNRYLEFEITADDQQVFVKAADGGKGIPEEALSRIFRPGYTTDPDKKGYGLHYSGNYIYEMGGHIKAESDGLNQGTSITIALPLSDSAENKTSFNPPS